MTRLFKNRYRVDTWRAPWWNYRDPGWYFVTVCTYLRVPWFGDVAGDRMRLNEIGRIVDDEWHRTSFVRPNVYLDAFVVMPNHWHGLLEIRYPWPPLSEPEAVDTPAARLWPGSLGAIVGQIKSMATKRIRASGETGFAWQTRFYDRILRATDHLDRVRAYIRNNPRHWRRDRFHRG